MGARVANSGSSNKNSPSFHGEGVGLDVANDLGASADLDPVGYRNVPLDPALYDNRTTLDFGLNVCGFSDGQGAFGYNFPLNFPVHDQVVLEADLAFDLYVRSEHVALRLKSPLACSLHLVLREQPRDEEREACAQQRLPCSY